MYNLWLRLFRKYKRENKESRMQEESELVGAFAREQLERLREKGLSIPVIRI